MCQLLKASKKLSCSWMKKSWQKSTSLQSPNLAGKNQNISGNLQTKISLHSFAAFVFFMLNSLLRLDKVELDWMSNFPCDGCHAGVSVQNILLLIYLIYQYLAVLFNLWRTVQHCGVSTLHYFVLLLSFLSCQIIDTTVGVRARIIFYFIWVVMFLPLCYEAPLPHSAVGPTFYYQALCWR